MHCYYTGFLPLKWAITLFSALLITISFRPGEGEDIPEF